MIATTDQKARLLDLTIGVLELVRDGNRDIEEVSSVFQAVKDDGSFYAKMFAKEELPDPAPAPLLKFLGTVRVPATTERFVAKDKFVEDTSRKATVKICGTGSNFNNLFLRKI